MNTYRILESNMDRLQKKLTRIRTKCEKYGCDFYYEEVGEEFEANLLENGDTQYDRYVIVACEGTAVINDWEFVATIDHTESGNLIRAMKDIKVPDRYYTCGAECEHCHSKRHRKDTYIVHNTKTDEFKQVGSSCLCDFTHGFSADAAAAYISLFDELIKGEEPCESGRSETYYPVRDILSYAVDYVSRFGYVSTSEDQLGNKSTKTRAYLAWCYDNAPSRLFKTEADEIKEYREKYSPDYTSSSIMKHIDDMLDYIRNLDDDNDYFHNLKVIANSEYITGRSIGYAVSIVSCYNKYLDRQAKEEERRKESEESSSKYVGFVGARVAFNPVCIDVVTSWETQYGMTIRYKMYDADGNCYMWDSSSGIREDDFVEVVSITGTVKKHDTFNGIQQTWLTRCRVNYRELSKEERIANRQKSDVEDAIADFLNYVNQ